MKKKSSKRPSSDQANNNDKKFKAKRQKFEKKQGKPDGRFEKKTAGKKTPFPKKKSFGGQNTKTKGKTHDNKNNEGN